MELCTTMLTCTSSYSTKKKINMFGITSHHKEQNDNQIHNWHRQLILLQPKCGQYQQMSGSGTHVLQNSTRCDQDLRAEKHPQQLYVD